MENAGLTMNRRNVLGLSASMVAVGYATGFARAAAPTPFEIELQSRVLEVNGKAAKVFGIAVNGKSGGLITRFGTDFAARIQNGIGEETLIHWHGLTPPVQQDGVPGLSGPTLKPGDAKNYLFRNNRTGTHWMHSHFGLQEQQLLAAPLIVQEDGASLVDEQEHVVLLHDFTFRDPQEILQELQGGGGLHAGHNMGVAKPDENAHAGHTMGAAMPAKTHLADIAYDAMLANDRTLDDPEVVQAEKGGRFRLRVINGAAASNMWIELGALEGELIAVDGNSIRPVKGKRFPLAVAQRADVRLSLPAGSGTYPVLFTVEGSDMRSGIVLKAGDGAVLKLSRTGAVAAPLDLTLEPQLVSIAELPDNPVSRTDFVMLTGGEQNYAWGFNGKPMMHETLLTVREGERYEMIMHNMTSMAHPMHLHGHYFRVVGIDGQRFNGAIRDTVLVPPGSQVAIQFDADNPGTWAFHCHHLYHMNSGMMAAIAYSSAA
jgi:FtsP/CotA-like multicopper oxidase with cupredoxin domain